MSDADLLSAAMKRHRIETPGCTPTPAAIRNLVTVYALREADYARRQSARRSGRASEATPLTLAEAVSLLARRPGRPKAGQSDGPTQTTQVTADDLLHAALQRHSVQVGQRELDPLALRRLAVAYAGREAREIARESVRKSRTLSKEAKIQRRSIIPEMSSAKAARLLNSKEGRPALRDLGTVLGGALAGMTWPEMQSPMADVSTTAEKVADALQVHTDLDPDPTYIAKSVRRLRKTSGAGSADN